MSVYILSMADHDASNDKIQSGATQTTSPRVNQGGLKSQPQRMMDHGTKSSRILSFLLTPSLAVTKGATRCIYEAIVMYSAMNFLAGGDGMAHFSRAPCMQHPPTPSPRWGNF